jgi:hypothetical protein
MHSPGPVKTAALAPGQRALAWLGVAETVLFTGASCNPVLAHWLRVYPPDLRHAVYLPIKALTCSSPLDQVLEIRPGLPRFLNHRLPSKPSGSQRQSERISLGRTTRTHSGIMWVTFGHLRPSGHIMPDHGGDRGAVLLVLAPHDHLHIKQERAFTPSVVDA